VKRCPRPATCYQPEVVIIFSNFFCVPVSENKTRRLENTEAERAAKIKEVQKEIQVQNITTSYEISEIVFFTTEPRSSVGSKASFHGVQFETKN